MLQIISEHKLLLVVLGIAAVLRLWGLGINPPHLTSDEAALGYNAYSILKTAKDEHGRFLPIVFESFGDWKPGLYVYATIPFVVLFGLNEFSVRLASALAGVIAVWLVYQIAKRLFTTRIGYFAALFLAFSPWHLQFSRGAWEANLSLTLLLAGVYFFFRAIYKNSKYVLVSLLFFSLTFWAYQGAKLSTSVVVGVLFLVFSREVIKLPKLHLFRDLLLAGLVVLPIALGLLQGEAGRLEVYSVFSYPRPEQYMQEILNQENVTRDSWQYYLYHSEPLNFLRGILGRWMNHFSGRFLFFEGDWSSPRHRAPETGMLLFADLIVLLFGFIALARLKDQRATAFLVLWLLLAPLPAVLSRDSVHAVRSFNMVVPLVFILALGSNYLLENLQTKTLWQRGARLGLGALYFFSFTYYLDQYWLHAPKVYSEYWHYGYRQIVERIIPIQSQYEKIVVQQSYSQPYIFFLFYEKYDPAKYQAQVASAFVPSEYGDVGLVSKLDNIEFREIAWREDRGKSGTLFVGDLMKIPPQDSSVEGEFNVLEPIKFLNDKTAFRLVEVKRWAK